MPVVSVSRMWSNLGTSIDSDDGKRYTFSQNESYQVTVTVDPPTFANEIYLHPDVPKTGQRLAGTLLPIFCKSVSASQKSPILFQVDCAFSTVGELAANASRLLTRGQSERSPMQYSLEQIAQNTAAAVSALMEVKGELSTLKANLPKTTVNITPTP